MAMVPKRECDAVRSDGTVVHAVPGQGCTLIPGTYYFAVSTPDAPTASVHLVWSATLAASSIVFQDTNLPEFKAGSYSDSGADASDIDATVGNWITENPSTAYVPIVGAGATVTNMTIALAGGAQGGAVFNLGNLGTRRGRIVAVVTTGGVIRVVPWGKS